jgi:hypothetical protein
MIIMIIFLIYRYLTCQEQFLLNFCRKLQTTIHSYQFFYEEFFLTTLRIRIALAFIRESQPRILKKKRAYITLVSILYDWPVLADSCCIVHIT